jgi:hypothetical protein
MVPQWDGGHPTTFEDLFSFYHNYVKVLYAAVQTKNQLPSETLFELNAALDHISRHWAYNEDEPEVVSKAYGHLKRSCYDIFKLKVKETREQLDEIKKVKTHFIDNGEFDSKLNNLFHKIKTNATNARKMEGSPGDAGFEMWKEVYADCVIFENTFYLHKGLSWAKRKSWWDTVSKLIGGGLIATLFFFLRQMLWAKYLAKYFH